MRGAALFAGLIAVHACGTVGAPVGKAKVNGLERRNVLAERQVNQIPGIPSNTVITISNGPVRGATDGQATRYTLPYAQPPVGALRFQDPQQVKGWSGIYDASKPPSPCPQSMSGTMSSTNEDCLYLQVYVPSTAKPASGLPVFVWVHGGSFVGGGSTAAGLDGSTLAKNTGMIVIAAQYRLGFLGFMKASGANVKGNMAVKDMVMALSYIKTNIAAFGGDASRVTLAGQSSGASLIKTLLTVPSADTLFGRAILHSAPLDYSDQTSGTADAVGAAATSALGCSTLACLQGLPVNTILNAQGQVYTNSNKISAAVSQSQPFAPWVDGSLVVQDFVKAINGANGGLTNKNRQIIFTTVKDEAAPTIANISGSAIPPQAFNYVVSGLLNPPSRYDTVTNSNLYDQELDTAVKASDDDATRNELDVLGTDYIWRCATQQSAVNLTTSASMSGKMWLAEFDVGITYPSNANIPFCQGKICHEDDIFAVFGTGTGLNAAQQLLTTEVAQRWSSFASTGNPNANGFVNWNPVQSASDVEILMFNNGVASSISQTQRPDACSSATGVWGRLAPFDAQLYS